VLAKFEEIMKAHPKITLALCGALFAVEVAQLSETCMWLAEAFREVHRAEVARDAAKAVSEALGG
jgi:hypothetical protein